MKLKIYNTLFLLTAMSCNSLLNATCDEVTKKMVITDIQKPQTVYHKIQNPLSGDLKNPKLLDAFKAWINYTDCAESLINNPAYADMKVAVQQAKLYALGSIIKLQTNRTNAIDLENIKQLIKVMDLLFITALREIHREVPTPSSWKKDVLASTLEDFFVGHEQFFKNYEATKKQFAQYKGVFDTQRIVDFVRNQHFIKKGPQEQNSINFLVDALEKTIIKLEENSKKAWFGKGDMQRKIGDSKEIIAALIKQYPFTETSQMYQKISFSQNIALLILLAEAGSLLGILKRIENYLEKNK